MRIFFYIIILVTYALFSSLSKSIVISAATSGIGSQIARDLAENNYDLILLGRNKEKLEQLKNELSTNKQINVQAYEFDYSKIETIEAITKKINSKIHGIIVIPPRPSFGSKEIPGYKEWQEQLNNCFIAPLEMTKLLSEKIVKDGRVIIISGITGHEYLPAYQNSNIIRVMWRGEIKNLIHQLKNNKIRVNAISPYLVLTDHTKHKIENRAKTAKKSYDEQLFEESSAIPIGRFSEPEDISNLVSFLMSDKSSDINGVDIVLDGGMRVSY